MVQRPDAASTVVSGKKSLECLDLLWRHCQRKGWTECSVLDPMQLRRQAPNTDTFPDTSDVQTSVLVAVEVREAETDTPSVFPGLQGPSAGHRAQVTPAAILQSQESKGLDRDRGL